jgi:hypothetical protein
LSVHNRGATAGAAMEAVFMQSLPTMLDLPPSQFNYYKRSVVKWADEMQEQDASLRPQYLMFKRAFANS